MYFFLKLCIIFVIVKPNDHFFLLYNILQVYMERLIAYHIITSQSHFLINLSEIKYRSHLIDFKF